MRFSLGQRLFAAALLSFAVVGGVSVELLRWQFLDNFADVPQVARDPRLDELAGALAARYAEQHDWSFLPADPVLRRTWLQSRISGSPGSSALAERLALEDVDGHVLAGALPSRWLVAVTSIDTNALPLVVDGREIGRLIVAKAQRPDDDLAVAFLITQQRRLGSVMLIGVLASGISAAWLAASFRRPVRQLVDGARELEAGRFDARLTTTRGDELGELAQTFNHLAEKLGDTERARLRWMGDTSHELRTPLAVLRAQLEALQDGVRAATPATVSAMLLQVDTLIRLVDELQALTPPPPMRTPIDAWAVVVDTATAFGDRIRATGLTISTGATPDCSTVAGDAERLRQVIANLLENSVRHTDAGGRIDVSARTDGQALHVTLDDTAPGVPAAALGHLGDRFFRVDPSRSRSSGGSGRGLAVSRQIVEAHAGRLEFEASPLGGLRAVVTLPLAR